MKIFRKLGLMLVAAALGVGLVGVSAPAHADTSWGTVVGQR